MSSIDLPRADRANAAPDHRAFAGDAAFGNELEGGTLPYLLMKPVSRLRLILGT